MGRQEHWEQVYRLKDTSQVSWFRPHLELPLAIVERVAPHRSAAIVDMGGGSSTFVDDLLERGYSNLTVVDISQAALDISMRRCGGAAASVQWLCADATLVELPERHFDVWHDRAVFHFLTGHADRINYLERASLAVKPGGHLIVSTFGPDGPLKCSGLDTMRYSAASLCAEFGPRFHLEESWLESHRTPFGTDQQFLCCHFRRED